MKPILEIDSLKKYYGKPANQTKALDGISFQVMPGEFLGIMGSSGSGKSTLLNCIATVILPTGGQIIMKGTRLNDLKGAKLASYRGKEIGYLFQNFELLDNLTGQENILLPLSLHNVPEAESRKRLAKLADYLEIDDVLEKFQIRIHVSGENVYTDRRGFCFLLSQFVSNAIKYSKDSPELSFYFQTTDQSNVLIIRDNGTGVPSCDLPFIFEKGFTGDSGKNRKKATGMGLFLAKEIAGDLNISLNAYSEYGKGFEMQMEFPVFHCF